MDPRGFGNNKQKQTKPIRRVRMKGTLSKWILSITLMLSAMVMPTLCFGEPTQSNAGEVEKVSAASVDPALAVKATEVQTAEKTPDAAYTEVSFLADVLKAVKDFGGLDWMARVASIILLIVSSLKVTFLRQLIWDKLDTKLGDYKALVPLALSLVAGILGQGSLSWTTAVAYLGAGAGAIVLHELLDAVKSLPGIGSVWKTIIEIVMNVFGAQVAPKKS